MRYPFSTRKKKAPIQEPNDLHFLFVLQDFRRFTLIVAHRSRPRQLWSSDHLHRACVHGQRLGLFEPPCLSGCNHVRLVRCPATARELLASVLFCGVSVAPAAKLSQRTNHCHVSGILCTVSLIVHLFGVSNAARMTVAREPCGCLPQIRLLSFIPPQSSR